MGVTVNVSFTAGPNITDNLMSALQQGVSNAGERLLALSSERVPLDQGTLMGSGAVSTPLVSAGSDPVTEVTYDTPYAARLHEHPEYNFQGGRQGKYLESAALENRAELGAIIAAAVQRG